MFGVYSVVFGLLLWKVKKRLKSGALPAKARCPGLPLEAFWGIFLYEVRETEVLGLLQV